MSRRALTAITLIVAIAAPRVAAGGDPALAESLFQQGLDLMDTGDYAAACPKLRESLAQDEATGTLLALALCQEQSGQTASAWAGYAEVSSRAKRDGRPDREQAAREKMKALEPRLSRLTIEVDAVMTAVPGLVITRDGLPIGQGAWGTPAPVDPGDHVVRASAPGKRPWQGTVTIGAVADARVLRVPLLDDEPVPVAPAVGAPVPPRSSAVPPPRSPDARAPPTGSPLRTLGLVAGGLGIVGISVSAYFGVSAKNLQADSEDQGCLSNDQCPPGALETRNSAVDAANAATVTLVAGGLLVGTGVTLYLVGSPSSSAVASIEAAPAVGGDRTGVLVRGRF